MRLTTKQEENLTKLVNNYKSLPKVDKKKECLLINRDYEVSVHKINKINLLKHSNTFYLEINGEIIVLKRDCDCLLPMNVTQKYESIPIIGEHEFIVIYEDDCGNIQNFIERRFREAKSDKIKLLDKYFCLKAFKRNRIEFGMVRGFDLYLNKDYYDYYTDDSTNIKIIFDIIRRNMLEVLENKINASVKYYAKMGYDKLTYLSVKDLKPNVGYYACYKKDHVDLCMAFDFKDFYKGYIRTTENSLIPISDYKCFTDYDEYNKHVKYTWHWMHRYLPIDDYKKMYNEIAEMNISNMPRCYEFNFDLCKDGVDFDLYEPSKEIVRSICTFLGVEYYYK